MKHMTGKTGGMPVKENSGAGNEAAEEYKAKLKAEYEAMFKEKVGEYEAVIKAKDAELGAVRLENAVETGLLKAGGRNLRILSALIDRDKISLNEGVVSGLDEQIAALKADADTAAMFNDGKPKLAGEALPEEGADFRENLSYEQYCEMEKGNF